MNHPEDCSCSEYRALSRRGFVTLAGANAAALAVPAWLPRLAFKESEDTSRDIVVSVFMRGGADDMSLVAPFGDPDYYSGRHNIAVPRPDSTSATRGVALDNFFMFPQAMGGLLSAFRERHLLLVHATPWDARRYAQRVSLAEGSGLRKVTPLPGVGDAAFYVEGTAGALAGTRYVEINGLRGAARRAVAPAEAGALLKLSLERLQAR